MGRLLNVVSGLHTRTQRDYLARMNDDKVHCMEVARRFDAEYWDGDRRYGYGGNHYDGRWKPVAEKLIAEYRLRPDARILDVGCGKAFLLHEFTQLLPQCTVVGVDISEYALAHAKEEIRSHLLLHSAADPLPFSDHQFDLALSINTVHNLQVEFATCALAELNRVAKNQFLVVEAFRTPLELMNLQCWSLTCEAFLRPESWEWLFEEAGYEGDYEFIYFE